MKYKAEVTVTLKNGVRDPQGAALDTVLKRTKIEEDSNVNVGKYFSFTLTAEDENEAKKKANQICEDVLSNPILESYKIGRFEKL